MEQDHGRVGCAGTPIDFNRLFMVAPTPQLLVDRDLFIVAANEAYLRATTRSCEQLRGRHIFEVFPDNPGLPDADGVQNLRASLERVRDSGVPDSMAMQRYDVSTPQGGFAERYWSPVNVPLLDEDGAVEMILHQVYDVTDYVREQEQLQQDHAVQGMDWRRRMEAAEADLFTRGRELQEVNRQLREAQASLAARALHDPLTGLLIRSVFVEELAVALRRRARHRQPLAVLFIDLDRLKHVNDTYGHPAGDELIRCCARRLRESLRPEDSLARIGGDEFVALLQDLHDPADAATAAERVLAALRSPCQLGAGVTVRPTASIGVAVAEEGPLTPETLIAHADAAMYQAKGTGGGGVAAFDLASYRAARARVSLEDQLRTALDGGQLRVHYQPIIDLVDGGIYAVEALVRWQHPDRGLLPAAEFIDVAISSGLISQIGDWVREQACRQLASWDATLGTAAPGRLFLNADPTELVDEHLSDNLEELLTRAHLSPDRLVIEVTETTVLHGTHADRTVQALRRLGCDLAIDDFGAGYSSLRRVMDLPAAILKIDQSLVRELHREDPAAAVVTAVLHLGRDLGKTVLAEGVENADTLRVLRDLGCRYVQGFYLGRPQPADQLTTAVERSPDWSEEPC